MTLTRLPGAGWRLTYPVTLTDSEARAATFYAVPESLTVGRYVEVVDPGGTRVGSIHSIVAAHSGLALATVKLS